MLKLGDESRRIQKGKLNLGPLLSMVLSVLPLFVFSLVATSRVAIGIAVALLLGCETRIVRLGLHRSANIIFGKYRHREAECTNCQQ